MMLATPIPVPVARRTYTITTDHNDTFGGGNTFSVTIPGDPDVTVVDNARLLRFQHNGRIVALFPLDRVVAVLLTNVEDGETA